MGGDCTDFASQCMLAAGTGHYNGNWKVYRKNGTYSAPKNVDELNNSWELCHPFTSPWLSAKEFSKFWKSKRVEYYTGAEIAKNNDLAWQASVSRGDIIQIALPGSYGTIGDPIHTMYIQELDFINETYKLSYHSDDYSTATNSKTLKDIVNDKSYAQCYFIFYQM